MKNSRNLWPVGIVVACGLFVAGTAALIVFACTQRVELVSHDYYEQELRFQNQIDRVERTRLATSQGSVAYDTAKHCITVSLPAGLAGGAVSGRIELYRPSAASLDRVVELDADRDGVQRLDAAGLAPGLWRVRVSWKRNEQNYYLEQKVVVGSRTS